MAPLLWYYYKFFSVYAGVPYSLNQFYEIGNLVRESHKGVGDDNFLGSLEIIAKQGFPRHPLLIHADIDLL